MSTWGGERPPGKALRRKLERLDQRRGLLIAFEGPDGSGKTTQRKLFKTWLQGEGHEVVTTKWNSSPLVKPLLRTRKAVHGLSPREYCLLHAMDFRHRLETEVLPAMCAGRTVIADRYLFTALARDSARGLDLDWVLKLYAPLLWPDQVYYFSVSAEVSEQRVRREREPTYYESGQDVTNLDDVSESYRRFVGRLLAEYQSLAVVFNFVTVDAERPVYEQHMLLRRQFELCQRRAWTEFNAAAVRDWLLSRPEVSIV
jgi:dTMP kinase